MDASVGAALRARWRWVAGIVGVAVVAVAGAATSLWLLWALGWANREPLGNPIVGINYSCNQAEYLLLETEGNWVSDVRPGRVEWCAETLGRILELSGARHVRLSVEWSQVEPERGRFDFALIDALLAVTGEHGARAMVTVGLKAQRHPEYYLPGWLLAETDLAHVDGVVTDIPLVRERAEVMVREVVGHLADSDVIDAWGADNEPYVGSSRGEEWSGWLVGRDFVQWTVATMHELDPQGRPVVVNHGQHWATDRRWKDALADGDVLGTSLYPFRNVKYPGISFTWDIVQVGPFMANYAYQSREAEAEGKELWMTELQGEPWFTGDPRIVSPENPSPNLSPGRFERAIEYGRRSGATRLYLWGAEWWLLQEEWYGDGRWFEIARLSGNFQD